MVTTAQLQLYSVYDFVYHDFFFVIMPCNINSVLSESY